MYQFEIGDLVVCPNFFKYGVGVVTEVPMLHHYSVLFLESSSKPQFLEEGKLCPYNTELIKCVLKSVSSRLLGRYDYQIEQISSFSFIPDKIKINYLNDKGDKNIVKEPHLSFEKNGIEIHINPESEICFKSNLQTDEAERMLKLLKETFNKQPVVLGNIEKEDVEFNKFQMPDIVEYNYNEDTGETLIRWSDNTETPVKAEFPDTASSHEGFMTACAKKAFGNNNTANNLFDEWTVKKPARETKAKIKANAAELEAKRIAEKRKTKREKWLIRRRAAEINREYEARKLANEKYGVPMENNIENGGK